MQAIRRLLTPSCLLLARYGPWLCQAEAAEGLARLINPRIVSFLSTRSGGEVVSADQF